MDVYSTTRGGNATGDAVDRDDHRRIGERVISAARTRRVERAWTAQVAMPLLMIATALSGLWVTWPLLLFASWWWTPSWNWSWLTVLIDGPFGTQWAYVGVASFAAFPDHFATVAIVWSIVPMLLAISGSVNRRLVGRKEWQADV